MTESGAAKQRMRPPREVAARVLEIEAAAIRGLLPQLDESFDRAVALHRAAAAAAWSAPAWARAASS